MEMEITPVDRTERFGINDMPNPTADDLLSPEFEAVWQAIKSWDVNVPKYYSGYCGATGSHVMLILNALRAVQSSTEG
jgi:hypothetical protein